MKTSNVVSIPQPHHAVVYIATVRSVVNNTRCEIDLSGIRCQAQVTFSCLVKPVNEDIVMCVLSEAGDYYITGIVERKNDQSMALCFPDNVSMQSQSGSINLNSSKSVNIVAPENFNCLAKNALHKSETAVMKYDHLTASGGTIQASFSTLRVFSELINTISKQALHKVKNYMRHTEESDAVKSGNMTRASQGLYSMNSQHTIMLSKKDTKIDGEHIHMG